jgi:hypothetical protein
MAVGVHEGEAEELGQRAVEVDQPARVQAQRHQGLRELADRGDTPDRVGAHRLAVAVLAEQQGLWRLAGAPAGGRHAGQFMRRRQQALQVLHIRLAPAGLQRGRQAGGGQRQGQGASSQVHAQKR